MKIYEINNKTYTCEQAWDCFVGNQTVNDFLTVDRERTFTWEDCVNDYVDSLVEIADGDKNTLKRTIIEYIELDEINRNK